MEAYFNRGITYANPYKRKETISDLTKVIEMLCEKYKTGRHIKNEVTQKIIATLIKDYYDKPLIVAFYNRGRNYDKLGMNDNAIEDYTKVIEFDDQHSLAYYFRAWGYLEQEKYEMAIQDYTKVLLVDDEDKEGYNYKSLKCRALCHEKLSQYEKAIECYTETIEFRKQYEENYLSRAHLYLKLKKYKEAIEDYSFVLQKSNKYSAAFLGRAEAYRELGDIDAAFREYKQGMEMRLRKYKIKSQNN